MVSVNIGLNDKELLGYFNTVHAALQAAEKEYIEAANTHTADVLKAPDRRPDNSLVNPKIILNNSRTLGTPNAVKKYKAANAKLIAELQVVIKEIQKASAFDEKASRWMPARKK